MLENESAGRSGVPTRRARPAAVMVGGCTVVLGAIIAMWPHKSVDIAGLLFGLYLVLSGVLQVIVAVSARFAMALRILVFVSGVLSWFLALLCFTSGDLVLLLGMWVGLGWTIRGVVQATVAVWTDEQLEAGKQELFGLFTVVLGIALIVVPYDSLENMAKVAGGCLIVMGALEILTVTRWRGTVVGVPEAGRVPVSPN
ncbi:HdeD family acid-resistance protein [Nocardia australiensis]|uniref:HdeD family acid-resistance protein n=1 Tax=Nocardia australiensis TaxID=2887191 RepID=UPI001D1461C3|nr:DUF308 domain-containing protein [Nocardia australiensis]